MDEILQKLLETELLSEEVKADISKKWAQVVEAKMAEMKKLAVLEVRSELANQWTTERDALVESLEKFVDSQLTEELGELKSDINRFRDVEAEYAAKLVEEKQKMADQLQEELDQLADKIDAFFDIRLAEEFEELKEDIDVVKQSTFGRQIFEAFVDEFSKNFIDEDSVHSKLQVTESKLEDASKKIAELESAQAKLIRESKMADVLKSLSGAKREQMAFILENVETDKLESTYKQFIDRVLKEEKKSSTSTVITEQQHTTLATGSKDEKKPKGFDSSKLRELAGIANK